MGWGSGVTESRDRTKPPAAEARREELRAALIAAAERRIAGDGLGSLRARDLAAEAGCALGAIYTAFPDLDALILEVNLRTLGLFEAALGPETDGFAATSAADELVRLGQAYLAFAQGHAKRWRALFQHQPADGWRPPDWYVAEQARLFRRIEAPLQALRPDLPTPERILLARSLFSATHGIVMLGLDPRLMALPVAVVRTQLDLLIRAMATGLAMGSVTEAVRADA